MKVLFEDYTFNAAAKQITFNTSDIITLERLLIITNVTSNIIIYNFADPNTGGAIANNVLTLDYNTALMNNGDSLQIFLDNQLTPASNEMLEYLSDQTALLGRMVKLLEPSSVVGSTGRQQVDILNISATPLVQNYQTYIGNFNTVINTVESTFNLQSRIAYATLRNKLEFS